MEEKKLSRRQFLQWSAFATASVGLAACAPQATQIAATNAPSATSVPATASSGSTAAPAATSSRVVQLHYQNHWGTTDAHAPAMAWMIQDWNSKNPNIQVISNSIPSDVDSNKKILTDCSAGNCPEIVHAVSQGYWDAGFILDLKPYVDADPEWKAAWKPEVWTVQLAAQENRLWGIPAEQLNIATGWNMLTLNKAGINAPPATWDEFMAAGDKLKSKGLFLGTTQLSFQTHAFNLMIFSRPGAKDAFLAKQWDNPFMRDALAKYKAFVDAKYNPPNDASLQYADGVALIQNSQAAFLMDGGWSIGNYITSKSADPALAKNFVFAPFPDTGNGTAAEVKAPNCVGIAAKLKDDQEALDGALKFFKYWTSKPVATQWAILSQSPEGVITDPLPNDKVPLLASFVDVFAKAKSVVSQPWEMKVFRNVGWGFTFAAQNDILSGKSIDEAMKTFVTYMDTEDKKANQT